MGMDCVQLGWELLVEDFDTRLENVCQEDRRTCFITLPWNKAYIQYFPSFLGEKKKKKHYMAKDHQGF